jgi:hypothetical protein
MALTKVSLVDLNAGELILDLDADTSITADTDDTIHLKIGGSDEITITGTALSPAASDGNALGTAALEWADLFLADGAVISLGDDQDVTLTHVADTGVLLNSTNKIQFNDASQFIHGSSATVLSLGATSEIDLTATAIDINGTCDVSGAFTTTTITASGIVKTDDTTEATSTTDGSLQTDGGLSVAKDAVFGDDVKLLSDAAVLGFGADGDVTLTHVHNTGVLLNSTMAIQFNDASQYINAPSNAILDINATDEIELNATLVDVNANLDVSGTITSGGVVTGTAFTAGSAVLAEAELELLDGLTAGTAIASKVVTTDANIDSTGMRNLTITGTFSDGNYTFDTSGNVSGLGTVGSGAITSSGIVTGTGFTAGSAVLAEAELELLDGLTAGTAIASKVVTTDASIDSTGMRNLTISGELDAATGDFSGNVDVDGTLEADAITIDGTAIASVLSPVAGHASIVTTGALDTGSITSGFGAIDNGTSNIRSATITAETAFVPDASDGAALGTSSLEFSDLFLADGAVINFGDDQDINITHVADTGLTTNADFTVGDDLFVSGGLIDLKNTGTVSTIKFYCESSNAHAQSLVAAPHSEGATNTLTLPGTGGNARLVSTTSTATLTNKTLTTPVIAEIDSGADITLDATADIVLDAAGGNIEFKDAGTLQLTIDMDGTAGVQIIKLEVDTDDLVFKQYDGNEVMRIADDRAVYFFDKGGEKISSDGTDFTFNSGNDINLTATTDINIPSNVGLTFGNDAEKIEGDGTDLTISGNNINLTATADVNIPSGVGLTFATAEKIESDGTDLSITVGSNGDINIPANIGLTFGDDGEKIEGDGTDLTIAGNNINLTATADVVIPANVGITFGTGEKIEGDSTDLTITSGAKINLTATSDVVIPANVGLTFGSGEKIEGDSTDLTITSGAKINLTATSDIHVPNNVGIVFGGDSEKIEGDGTDLVISANNLTIDAAADITLDAAGNDFVFASGGTNLLKILNSSSDLIFKPQVDGKDIIFQQYDGTSVLEINDGTGGQGFAKFTAAAFNAEVALTDASTISWNALTAPVAKVTLAGNRTLGAASGVQTGQFISILFIQDGTGSRTITFNAAYEHTGDVAPVLTTTVNKGDLFVYRYNGAKFLEVGRNLNLSLS